MRQPINMLKPKQNSSLEWWQWSACTCISWHCHSCFSAQSKKQWRRHLAHIYTTSVRNMHCSKQGKSGKFTSVLSYTASYWRLAVVRRLGRFKGAQSSASAVLAWLISPPLYCLLVNKSTLLVFSLCPAFSVSVSKESAPEIRLLVSVLLTLLLQCV